MHAAFLTVRGISSFCALSLVLLLASCGGGGGSSSNSTSGPPTYSIGGTVSSTDGRPLGAGLVLQNNNGDNLTVPANATSFSFATPLASGAAYAVTVLGQPTNPSQTCTVTSGGTGTVGSANVSGVTISCTTKTYTITGTVSGLAGSGLVLRNNGGDDLPISGDGAFSFIAPVASGAAYAVTVLSQPTNLSQTCTVTNGAGTVGGGDVTNVSISCTTNTFTVGGTVSGYDTAIGGGITLRLNGTTNLPVSANGTYNFPALVDGSSYSVAVSQQPIQQVCTVANPSGNLAGGNVNNVNITCATNLYSVGVTVNGLAGTGLVLRNNGGNDLPISLNGAVNFSTQIAYNSSYNVTVFHQPDNPPQTCTVSNASGTVLGNINLAVACTTNTSTVGGTIFVTGNGPLGANLVLQNNLGDNLSISAGASPRSFVFPPIAIGSPYSVTVLSNPTNPYQTCTVSNASGTVPIGPVTNVAVNCTTNSYKIKGTVSGLAGTGLKLRNNNNIAGDEIAISADGAFQFATSIASGATYAVTVFNHPTNLSQTCTVAGGSATDGSGTVTDADVTVSVSCATKSFTVGGTVSGSNNLGFTLRLTNVSAGGATSDLSGVVNGGFAFPAILDGSQYSVSVFVQPFQQTCTVGSGSGTLAGANITNVTVTCAANTYSVGGTITVDGGAGSLGANLQLRNTYGPGGINTENLTVAANATTFAFGTPVAYNSDYSVTVLQDPSSPSQHCTVTANGSGTVLAAVTNVAITCTTKSYTIGGTVTGLLGTGLKLRNNNNPADEITIANTGPFSFTFGTPIASGAAYAVTAIGPINNPTQSCTVTGGGAANNGSGTVADANVTNVVVTCTTSSFTIGGTINGLTGTGLVLHNGSENLQVGTGANSFQFATPVASGAAYAVTATGPISNPTQTCTVTGGGAANNGSGNVADANVTSVVVTCTTSSFKIGGTVSGLLGTGLVLHNGSENLTVAANATGFQFLTPVASGQAYAVTASGPISSPAQNCTVTGGDLPSNNGSGIVGNADVGSVVVTCTTSSFKIGGTISGLVGTGLKLHNSSGVGEDLNIAANATGFQFVTSVASGQSYAVTVSTQPSVPGQTCTVTGGGAANDGSGTVGSANVTNVVLTCVVPSPRFAYVANAKENTVSTYSVNAQTGQLRNRGYVAAGTDPQSVAIDPSGKFAYVANQVSSNVWVYSIDATTGALTNTSIAAGPNSGGSYSVVVDPSGKFAYVTNHNVNSVRAYAIGSNGALTPINCLVNCAASDSAGFATGNGPLSIRIDPSGRFVYVANTNSFDISAYTIDPSTGRLTPIDADPITAGIQAFPTVSFPTWVTIDPSGRFVYVTNKDFPSKVSAYAIDPITGALTPIGAPVATDSGPASVAVDPYGKFAYVASFDNGTITAYSIDSGTGALTAIGSPLAAGAFPSSVSVDSSGKFVYVPSYTSDTISAFAINPTTGALTALPTLTGRDGNIVLAMTSGTTPVANTPKFAYAANAGGTVSAYTINATTGALTHVGTDVAAGTGPASVSADPFGRFAYVANAGGDVSAYTITGTGALSQINCGGGGCVGANFAAGSNPKSVTVDPSGRFVYVANAGDGVNPSTVSAYAIDSGSGALAAIGSPLAAGINPISVSVDASGRFAYVVNSISNDISAYSVDATSGTLTPIDRDPVTTPLVVDNFPAGTTPRAIGVDPFGRFAYVVNAGTPGTISAYAIDTRSPTVVGAIPGALTAIGSPVATGTNPVSVTVDASGKFVYVANAGGGVSRYTIASDGTLTSNGTTTAGSGPASVTVAASTGSTVSGSHEFAYVANSGAGTVSGFSVNDSSGALTSVGAAAGAGSTPSSVTTTGTIQ